MDITRLQDVSEPLQLLPGLVETAQNPERQRDEEATLMTSEMNVADVERWACAIGGAALAAYGIKQLKDW